MFKAIVGHSTDIDSEDAISEVLTQCYDQLADQMPQAGILLAAIDFDHKLILSRIQTAFPNIHLIGCSTDGEISSIQGVKEDSITLMLFCSDTVTIRSGLGLNLSNDPQAAAAQAIESLDLNN